MLSAHSSIHPSIRPSLANPPKKKFDCWGLLLCQPRVVRSQPDLLLLDWPVQSVPSSFTSALLHHVLRYPTSRPLYPNFRRYLRSCSSHLVLALSGATLLPTFWPYGTSRSLTFLSRFCAMLAHRALPQLCSTSSCWSKRRPQQILAVHPFDEMLFPLCKSPNHHIIRCLSSITMQVLWGACETLTTAGSTIFGGQEGPDGAVLSVPSIETPLG